MATVTVNGTSYVVPSSVSTDTPLLWFLRDSAGLTGTKYGCGIEECGACTVLIDGEAERSCDARVSDAIGSNVTTIEGLSPTGDHPLQQAWISQSVPQCGYCQSGMLMAAAALLRRHPNPTDAQIDSEIDNICVCGTYQRIRAAIHVAAAALAGADGGGGGTGTGGGGGTGSGRGGGGGGGTGSGRGGGTGTGSGGGTGSGNGSGTGGTGGHHGDHHPKHRKAKSPVRRRRTVKKERKA